MVPRESEAEMARVQWIEWAAEVLVAVCRGEYPMGDALFAELRGILETLSAEETSHLGAEINRLEGK
jgi:hypothetical protein